MRDTIFYKVFVPILVVLDRNDQDGTSLIFDTFISFQTLITAVLFPQS